MQATDFPFDYVEDASVTEIHEWIKMREHHGEEITKYDLMELCFPEGPKEPIGDWIDMVIITDESAHQATRFNQFE